MVSDPQKPVATGGTLWIPMSGRDVPDEAEDSQLQIAGGQLYEMFTS